MLSETLAEGLDQYRIGPKIRALRQAKGLGLVQLGEHTGLSPGMLSKIERGALLSDTIHALARRHGVRRWARRFLRREQRAARFRRGSPQGAVAPARPAASRPALLSLREPRFPVANRKIEAFLAEFPAGSKPSPPHQHDGAELIYVIKGQLAVGIEGNETVLDEGDALYFESSVPHAYRREGPASCSAIVVVAPG